MRIERADGLDGVVLSLPVNCRAKDFRGCRESVGKRLVGDPGGAFDERDAASVFVGGVELFGFAGLADRGEAVDRERKDVDCDKLVLVFR